MALSHRQKRMASKIDGWPGAGRWYDWRWQVRHAVKDIRTFETLLDVRIDPVKREAIEKTAETFPISITPYYLSLIDTTHIESDPIFKQAFPSPAELVRNDTELADPLEEDEDSPVPGITHRYPDRVLFLVSNVCAMYCRHCTRKRKVGDADINPGKALIAQGLDYIRRTPAVRDVLLSGGDPFLLSDDYLDWILGELRAIPHVEIIRIGTRTPVVLPYRITDDLLKVLKRHQPVWINTHFNHPRELTDSSKDALARLADAGLPLGNQTVLLAGVNDCHRIIKDLCHKLVKNRVRPYYLFQCDLSEGLSHFRTPVSKGIEIMESMIGHTSGFAVPTYVIDAAGGAGKIPVAPTYLLSWATRKAILRNYEGVIVPYPEPETFAKDFCDRNCERCKFNINLESADEQKAVGIEKLLGGDEVSLTPVNTERLTRRRRKKA